MTDTITLPRSVVEQALEALNASMPHSNDMDEDWPSHIAARRALRAALDQPQDHHEQHLNMVPAGWKLVPVEPTDEMREAGKDAHYEAETRTSDADAWSLTGFAHRVVRASYIYRAMLAASPQPPVVEQPQGEQEPAIYLDANLEPVVYHAHPQPKREPLTDEQIREIGQTYTDESWIDEGWSFSFARAIEAAHGIRGGA